MVGSRFRIKLVGEANEFFFETYRAHVTVWKREVLGDDVIDRQSIPVCRSQTSVFGISFVSKKFGSYNAVTDIGLFSCTVNRRSMGKVYADVVKHGGFVNKVRIDI